MTSPSSPPPRRGPPKALLIGLVTALVGAAVAGAFVLGRKSGKSGGDTATAGATSGDTRASNATEVEGMPEPQTVAVDSPGSAALPAFWVDVHRPGKVRTALQGNAWLKEQLQKPLGQGFVGAWAAFLGSTGEDLKAEFKGAVLDLVAGQLLDAPFRAVWFAGDAKASTPALIVPQPGDAATAAYEALDGVATRGTMTAAACPGGVGTVPAEGFEMKRWLVAEQSLWAGRTEDRLVLSRHPAAVLQGLCTELPELEAADTVDVELGFDPGAYGRETQLLSHVVGLAPGTRLQFGVEGNRLVGRGIAGELMDGPARLDSAPLSDALLKLVPEDTPVLLAINVKLPESLDPATLKAFWAEGGGKGPTRTRQVALVWTPRGDSALPVELAVLWGRAEDAEALKPLFTGGYNALVHGTACSHAVMASNEAQLERLRKACEGKSPNLLNAAGPVVAGLREPASVAFGVNTGRLLSGLTMDGYLSEARVGRTTPMPKAAPPEIEAARRDLESLPYVGLRGTVQGDSLVPGGFGS